MKNIILAIKGFFIGIANIIPGVSGGTLMISLGIYEDIIAAISHFFKKFKENINLLFWIGLGAVVSIILMSRVVTFTLENYQLPTILFFIGLIIGGVPMLFKKVKTETKHIPNIIIFLIMFSLILLMTFTNSSLTEVSLSNMNLGSYTLLFFIGVIAAASMVIPGISGSFILIFLGYYEPILAIIKDFTSFNNLFQNGIILGVFGLGVLVGIVLVAKLIEYLLNKFEIKTYFAILGFVLASVISIFVTALADNMLINTTHILLSIPLFIIGFITAYKLGE